MQSEGTYVVSPASSRLSLSTAMFSRPARKDSRDLDMCPSCEFGSRFREIARCRSRSDSLMWSARRKSWLGLDMAGMLYNSCVNSLGWSRRFAKDPSEKDRSLSYNSLGIDNPPFGNKTASEICTFKRMKTWCLSTQDNLASVMPCVRILTARTAFVARCSSSQSAATILIRQRRISHRQPSHATKVTGKQ